MEIILLKSSICLLAFIAFYKVFLERTSNHQFKRFYLLGVVLISIAIPYVTFIEYIEPQAINTNLAVIANLNETQETPTNYLPIVLWSIYGLGVLLFTLRFIFNISKIALKIKKNPKQKTSDFISVLLKDLIVPHTFFNYIFFNKTKFENNEIPEEVLLHEQTHAKQKHSADILFIELLQIIFWFHPLVYILKKDIKLNHEFLADQAVINHGIETINYQKTLLSLSSNQQDLTLEHAINYSSIKKRFTVMKTQTSKKTLWFRSLLLLPLLAILIFSFSSKEQVEKEVDVKTQISHEAISSAEDLEVFITKDLSVFVNNRPTTLENLQNILKEFNKHLTFNDKQKIVQVKIKLEDNIEMGFLTDIKEQLRKSGYLKLNIMSPILVTKKQKKATPEQISEYNKLAKHYNATINDIGYSIKMSDLERIEYLYNIMSKKQKENAEPFPDFPKPPPAPRVNKGELSNIPPPPPPIPGNATPEQRKKMEAAIYEYEKKNKRKVHTVKNTKTGEVDNYIVNDEEYNVPPPPPPPKPITPLDLVIDMAKKDAIFYFDGKKIASDEAINIFKKDSELSISIQSKDLKRPIVNITTNPVITDKKGKVITKVETLKDIKSNNKEDRNGYVEINGATYFYSIKNKKITLFNRWGKIVNEEGEIIKK